MTTFKIMDSSGHTEQVFDRANKVSMEEAERRFSELTGSGFIAANLLEGGNQKHIRNFGEAGDQVLFHRQHQGG